MTSPRRSIALAVVCGLLSLLAGWLAGGPPDLRPVMPEVDGVHPVRALQALSIAYAPGEGFPDKYPPLGSFLLGLAAARADSWFAADAGDIVHLPDAERRAQLWRLRDRVAVMLDAERWVSRLAMALAVAFTALIALQAGAAMAGAGLAALLFLGCYPALYYGGTSNVDALCLAASLITLWLALRGRWLAAGAGFGLALAIKDPAFVLGPVLVLAAWRAGPSGRGRRVGGLIAAGTLTYAAAAGALTGPSAWWQHVTYVLNDGVATVDRIDHGRLIEWWALVRQTVKLLAGAIGWSGLLLGAAGIGRLLARRSAAGRLLAGAIASTLVLFVLPVGFVFARFLLLPLAALAIGAGTLLADLPSQWRAAGAERRRGLLLRGAVLIALACVADRHVADYLRITQRSEDPRRQAVQALEARATPGSRIVCFADEREHLPPLDPGRWTVENRRLWEVNELLPVWRAGPAAERPEFVLWMGFPIDRPSGLGPARVQPPLLLDLYEVIEQFGAPTGSAVESVLAVRPRLLLLRRLGS